MTVAEAKARLLEFGYRPRGPKAAIRRDPLTATALALVGGVLLARLRPGGLLPLGLLFSKPVMSRVLPLAAQFAASRAKAKAEREPRAGRNGAAPRPGVWEAASAVREWAMGPQPARGSASRPPGHRS